MGLFPRSCISSGPMSRYYPKSREDFCAFGVTQQALVFQFHYRKVVQCIVILSHIYTMTQDAMKYFVMNATACFVLHRFSCQNASLLHLTWLVVFLVLHCLTWFSTQV